jgi:Skp family chaperone for outer membrane proteins
MHKITKTLLSSALGMAGVVSLSVPATAQVNGIATANPARAIAISQARQTAYQQISTTYASQVTALNTARQQSNTLKQQLDTNKDGQLSNEEVAAAQAAKNPVLAQIQAADQQVETAQEPIARAQLFALEEILKQYEAAQQQVVSDKKISIIMSPDMLLYAPDSIDVTAAIAAALNTRVPAVSTTAPADWQPQRQTLALHQQVQELLIYNALLQQQRAAQSGAEGTAPARDLPEGR